MRIRLHLTPLVQCHILHPHSQAQVGGILEAIKVYHSILQARRRIQIHSRIIDLSWTSIITEHNLQTSTRGLFQQFRILLKKTNVQFVIESFLPGRYLISKMLELHISRSVSKIKLPYTMARPVQVPTHLSLNRLPVLLCLDQLYL